jgi:hypothetical protein
MKIGADGDAAVRLMNLYICVQQGVCLTWERSLLGLPESDVADQDISFV